MMTRTIPISLLALLPLSALLAHPDFLPETISTDLGGRVAIADMDGDGQQDVVLHVWGSSRGKEADGQILWFRNPGWQAVTVVRERAIFGDVVLPVDMDEDGDMDLLAALGNDDLADLWWYENQANGLTWKEHHFGLAGTGSEIKDLEVHDMDKDGLPDVIARLKSELVIWFKTPEGTYRKAIRGIQQREGMGLADLDEDGDTDVVLNGYWLENTGQPLESWPRHDIDPRFFEKGTQPRESQRWRDFSVRVAYADLDGDGHANLVLSHAEHRGFPVVWYTTSDPRGGPESWTSHELGVVDYAHTLQAADFDGDGSVDILAAGTRHDRASRIHVFYNNGKGEFTRNTWADSGPVYAAAAGDIDSDGDTDLVASYDWETPPLQIWRNTAAHGTALDHLAIEARLFPAQGDLPVLETVLETWWLEELMHTAPDALPAASLTLCEVDSNGSILDDNVPFQLFGSTPANPLAANLVGIAFLPGPREGQQSRNFRLLARPGKPADPLVHMDLPVIDEGAVSARIGSNGQTWFYDMAGAGFSSLVDEDGNDWISFSHARGARGIYRGIPNCGYPEGYMHPGKTLSATSVVRNGPLVVSLYSESHDEKWAGQWDLFPDHARFTLLRASHPFWFLYEGTPGGMIDPDGDRWLRSDGQSGPVNENWGLADRRARRDWVAFADAHTDRSILLVNHLHSPEKNSYWLMQESMTVFGFGRSGLNKMLDTLPATFSVRLVESRDPEKMDEAAAALLHTPGIRARPVKKQ